MLKTTKEQRVEIRKMSDHFRTNNDGPINRIIEPLLDDIDTLETRLEEYRKLLERAMKWVPAGKKYGGADIIEDYNALMEKKG